MHFPVLKSSLFLAYHLHCYPLERHTRKNLWVLFELAGRRKEKLTKPCFPCTKHLRSSIPEVMSYARAFCWRLGILSDGCWILEMSFDGCFANLLWTSVASFRLSYPLLEKFEKKYTSLTICIAIKPFTVLDDKKVNISMPSIPIFLRQGLCVKGEF